MRILLIENDVLLARSVERALRDEGMQVDRTGHGEDGIEICRRYDHDVVVLGLDLVDVGADEVLRRMRRSRIATPIVVLSEKACGEQRLARLGLAAEAYVEEPRHSRQLVARVRSVALEANGHGGPTIAVGRLRVDVENKVVRSAGGDLIPFTPPELTLVAALALRKGRIVRREALMDRLYSSERAEEPYHKIINVFIHRIRRRILAATGEEHIQTFWRRGYALRDPAEIPTRQTPPTRRPAAAALPSRSRSSIVRACAPGDAVIERSRLRIDSAARTVRNGEDWTIPLTGRPAPPVEARACRDGRRVAKETLPRRIFRRNRRAEPSPDAADVLIQRARREPGSPEREAIERPGGRSPTEDLSWSASR